MEYSEMKVYRVTDRHDNYSQVGYIYICRVRACDAANSGCIIREERILYTGECPNDEDILCRVREYKGSKATSWYKTQEEAWDAAKLLKLNDPIPEELYLDTDQIDPLDKEFWVDFQLDEKGRPYTRINAHPEQDGHKKKGKIFFPDRSFVGADLGRAKVSISKEFDTYGFLTGKMEPYEMVDMNNFLDWAWENEDPDTPVFFINHPGRGRYIAIESIPYAGADRCIMRIVNAKYDWSEQRVWKGMAHDRTVERDVAQYTERKVSLTQLYLEDAWEMEVDPDAILDMFDDDSFFWNTQGIKWERSIKFWNKSIDAACQKGFLTQYCIPKRHIEIILVNPDRLDMLSHFTYEEVCEMAKLVNEVNAAAKERLLSQVRKF